MVVVVVVGGVRRLTAEGRYESVSAASCEGVSEEDGLGEEGTRVGGGSEGRREEEGKLQCRVGGRGAYPFLR